MKHGSLFSGIGGFDLAAQWMGWENVFHCEWNEFGQRVLKHYWPNAISYDDIKATDFTIHRGQIDILTGGFPCQPYSQAGKRLGKEDDRHLWPEMLRAIQEIQPSYIVGENVRGITNWNDGMVFDEIQADMEAEGYEVLPFLLPAIGVNAPHKRDRIWFVAYSEHCGYKARREEEGKEDSIQEKRGKKVDARKPNRTGLSRNTSNSKRGSKQGEYKYRSRQGKPGGCNSETPPIGFENFPTQSPICNGDDGLSSELDGITFPKWRTESVKAGGNAIVPQVAYQIFKSIEEITNLNINT